MAAKPKPSERPKKRYVVFEVKEGQALNLHQVVSALEQGCHGFQDKGMKIITDTWDQKANQGIVRIRNQHAKALCEAINSIEITSAANAQIRTIGMSGTLRKAKLKFMKNKAIRKENKRNYHHKVHPNTRSVTIMNNAIR